MTGGGLQILLLKTRLCILDAGSGCLWSLYRFLFVFLFFKVWKPHSLCRPGLNWAYRPQFAYFCCSQLSTLSYCQILQALEKQRTLKSDLKGANRVRKRKLRRPENNPPGWPGWAVMISLFPPSHSSFQLLNTEVTENNTYLNILENNTCPGTDLGFAIMKCSNILIFRITCSPSIKDRLCFQNQTTRQ